MSPSPPSVPVPPQSLSLSLSVCACVRVCVWGAARIRLELCGVCVGGVSVSVYV